ncbi:MAG: hypothetical protein EOM25_07355 [Deltaproteobacteria bacterium]|nr:hypothetical protein [Deltaproteobacteria bacterium]
MCSEGLGIDGPAILAPKPRRFLPGQSGQTTVFLALSMMVFICFLAFMVDVGQLVHDKILTQNAADMIALSGANVQAAGMNELADLNWEYYWLQQDLRRWLLVLYNNPGSIRQQIMTFKKFMFIVRGMMEVSNVAYQVASMGAAYKAWGWYDDQYGGFDPPIVLPWPLQGLTELGETSQVILISSYVQTVPLPVALPCFIPIPFRPFPLVPTIAKGVPVAYVDVLQSNETYMRKADNAETTSFVVLLSRESRPVFVNLPSLGFDVEIPRIFAASALIPTGGSIEDGDPSYFARFVPLEELDHIPFLGYVGFKH